MATKDYTDISEELRKTALEAAAGKSGNAAPTYAGTYDDQLNDIFNRIQNREDFSYDVNADPLYQQYKDKYVTQGKLAMKDTMGQAAGLTGGYGSTYSAQVGQQTYDSYLQNLSDAIPELYGMAYSKYQDEGNALKDQYAMTGQMRDTEYNRYRDELGDWNYQQEQARALEQQEYERRINEENAAWSKQQQAYSNLVALIRASGYQPTNAELTAAGLTRAAANALRNEFLRGITPTTSGGGGGGGGGKKKKIKEITGPDITLTLPKTPTSNDVMSAYNKAVQSGNIADANKLLTAASALGIVKGVNKREALEKATGKKTTTTTKTTTKKTTSGSNKSATK